MSLALAQASSSAGGRCHGRRRRHRRLRPPSSRGAPLPLSFPLLVCPRPYSFGEVAGERWLTLLPKKWRGQQIYSWRYDPREVMASAAAPERDQRRANALRMEVDA